VLAALALTLALPDAAYAADMGGLPAEMSPLRAPVSRLGLPPLAGMVALGLVLGPTFNVVGALGEEIGWRGFLYKELSPLGFWRCAWITGVLWALWHVPVLLEGYVDPQHPIASAIGAVAFVLAFAPVLQLVRARAGSVVACAVLHGTLGSTRLVAVAFVQGAGPWAHAAIPIVLLGVDLIIARRLARGQP
jgi:membrane protease YdiL (CAAX protease family)